MFKLIRAIVLLCAIAMTISSCGAKSGGGLSDGDRPSSGSGGTRDGDERSGDIDHFDPLATARDREVAPEIYPVNPRTAEEPGDSLFEPLPLPYAGSDSTAELKDPTEVYRVQIFTSRLYNEARQEKVLAEEIFNFPVHLDYEVPYYKLRVGDFLTRAEAENFIPETKAIGYRSAWVARVVLKILPPPPLDRLEQPLLPKMPDDTTGGLIDMPGSLLTPIVVDSLDSLEREQNH